MGSWACNEGETSENAALVFLSGYFYKGNNASSVTDRVQPNPGNIHVFPSPCYTDRGCDGVTLTGLPLYLRLSIYNIEGEEVYRATATNPDGRIFWNLIGNRQVPQGIYFFTVTGKDEDVYHGNVTVIR